MKVTGTGLFTNRVQVKYLIWRQIVIFVYHNLLEVQSHYSIWYGEPFRTSPCIISCSFTLSFFSSFEITFWIAGRGLRGDEPPGYATVQSQTWSIATIHFHIFPCFCFIICLSFSITFHKKYIPMTLKQ